MRDLFYSFTYTPSLCLAFFEREFESIDFNGFCKLRTTEEAVWKGFEFSFQDRLKNI